MNVFLLSHRKEFSLALQLYFKARGHGFFSLENANEFPQWMSSFSPTHLLLDNELWDSLSEEARRVVEDFSGKKFLLVTQESHANAHLFSAQLELPLNPVELEKILN